MNPRKELCRLAITWVLVQLLVRKYWYVSTSKMEKPATSREIHSDGSISSKKVTSHTRALAWSPHPEVSRGLEILEIKLLANVFAVGGFDPSHGNTELMPIESWKWMPKSKYPFLPAQRSHAVIYFDGMFYVFGGSHHSAGNNIAGYHEQQNYWKRLGTLNFHRISSELYET